MSDFCPAPKHHIAITSQELLRPCCWYTGMKKQPSDLFSDGLFAEVTSLQNPGCNRCALIEERNLKSRRLDYLEKYKHLNSGIYYLDLSFSNLCNLKCLMCNSHNSTKWQSDEKVLNQHGFGRAIASAHDMSDSTINQIIDYCNSYSGPEFYLDIKGGEPFIHEQFKYFLTQLNSTIKQKTDIRIISNGTIIDNVYLEELSNFKSCKVIWSIEGTGDLYSYIRGGSKFSITSLEETIKLSREYNIHSSISATIMIYNMFHLNDLHEWITNIVGYSYDYNNVVVTPAYLDPRILPPKLKTIIADRTNKIPELNKLMNYMWNQHKLSDQLFDQFIKFTQILDKQRKTNVLAFVPELEEYL